MASSTIKNNELKSSTDYGKLSTRYSTSMRWPCARWARSEEHTSELQSQSNLVCRLLLEKKKNHIDIDCAKLIAINTVYCPIFQNHRQLINCIVYVNIIIAQVYHTTIRPLEQTSDCYIDF